MSVSSLNNAFWIAQPVLQGAVASMMLHRKLHKKYPRFFTYAVAQIAIFGILYPILNSGMDVLYFYVYWCTQLVSLALGFIVIHEVFVDVFRPYHTLKDLGTVLFKWASLVMILVAGVVTAASSGVDQDPLSQAVTTIDRCVRVSQCGLILFLLVFSRYLGVSWKQRSFGIALGFGGFASVELFAVALRAGSHIGPAIMDLLLTGTYCLAILVWFGYMWVKGTKREPAENLLTSQRWEESLTDLHHPVSADSLIPMFEGMVDRAFSKTKEPENDDAHSKPQSLIEELLSSASAPSGSSKNPQQ